MPDKNLRILVTNDDGITAKGIRTLVEVAKAFGTVTVVAPNKPQSAMGHAITLAKPLRLIENNIFGEEVKAYECTGTPVDCVKLAKDQIFKNQLPDLCLSGINHGSNAAINVIYSGTMSAAMEAAIEGVNAIGFSSLNYAPDADMTSCAHYAKMIVEMSLSNTFPQCNLLNVNFPAVGIEQIKGIKFCRQADARWKEEFDKRVDPFGREYFWMTGKFMNNEPDATDTDIYALEHNYVSVVPVKFDLTAYNDLETLNKEWASNETTV